MRYSEFLTAMDSIIREHLEDAENTGKAWQWRGTLFGQHVCITTSSAEFWNPSDVMVLVSINYQKKLDMPHYIKLGPEWVLALLKQQLNQY